MDSWESTLLVLKDTESFRAYFIRSPYLTDPKLLFELNSSGFARKSTAMTIDAGAGIVNNAIADMKRDLANFCKEQTENNVLVQRQVVAIHINMENQTNAVTLIGNQLQQLGLSLLAGHDEKAIEGKITAIDNSLMFESQCLHMTDDPAEKLSIKSNITALQTDHHEQTQLLAKASETTLKLMGLALGSIALSLPVHNPIQTPIPIDPILLNPISQLPPPQTPSQSLPSPVPNQSSSTHPCSPPIDSPFSPALFVRGIRALDQVEFQGGYRR